MTKLFLTVITMTMATAACADQTSDSSVKSSAAVKTPPAVESASNPTPVAEAPKPQPVQVAEAPKTEPAQVAEAPKDKAEPAADAAKDKPAQVAAAGDAPYKVSEDGKKVDAKTYDGYAQYTNVCVPCHGRDATGGMGGGANLVESLKKLSPEETKRIILEGKPGTLMAGFGTDPNIKKNIDGIYAYLKGRSDGKIWGKSLEKLQ